MRPISLPYAVLVLLFALAYPALSEAQNVSTISVTSYGGTEPSALESKQLQWAVNEAKKSLIAINFTPVDSGTYELSITLRSGTWKISSLRRTNEKILSTRQIKTGPALLVRTELKRALDEAIKSLEQDRSWMITRVPETAEKRELTLKIAESEGAEVYLEGGEFLGTVKDGVLVLKSFTAPDSATLELEIIKEGRDQQNVSWNLEKEGETLAVSPLKTENHWAAGVEWGYPQSLGAGVVFRWIPFPEAFHLQLGYYGSQVNRTDGTKSLIVHDLQLLGSALLWGKGSLFKGYYQAGGGTYLTQMGDALFTDPYLVPASLSLELHADPIIIFLRSDLRLTFGGLENSLMGFGFVLSSAGIPPITLGVLWNW